MTTTSESNETLQAIASAADEIPLEIHREIDGLTSLPSTELHLIAASEMTENDQAALEHLLDLQNTRLLTTDEQIQMETLQREYGRVLLRKARAFALLTERGQSLLT